MAAALLAMNEVYGRSSTSARPSSMSKPPHRASDRRDLFVFDDRLHMVRA
jgi:hypothetical protein